MRNCAWLAPPAGAAAGAGAVAAVLAWPGLTTSTMTVRMAASPISPISPSSVLRWAGACAGRVPWRARSLAFHAPLALSGRRRVVNVRVSDCLSVVP